MIRTSGRSSSDEESLQEPSVDSLIGDVKLCDDGDDRVDCTQVPLMI